MSDADATIVASTFQSLIQGYTIEQALAALTEDFVDYSSAVSIVINKGAAVPNDITKPIFTSREQFMLGHGKQKPIPFETLDVFHNCNGTVSMRWLTTRSALGQPTEAAAIPVPGLVILETEPAEEGNEYNYRIHTIYSEVSIISFYIPRVTNANLLPVQHRRMARQPRCLRPSRRGHPSAIRQARHRLPLHRGLD